MPSTIEWAAPPRHARSAEDARSLSRGGVALLVSAWAVWTAALGAAAIWRHDHFLSHRFDLGNMVQAVWSTTQGRPLEMTDDLSAGEQLTRLGAHVDPILVLYAPLWLLHPGVETLLVAQAAALASGVYPVVRLALKYTGSNRAAGLLGAWYLLFPWVIWLGFNECNPLSLSLPLLLYAIWFLDEERLGWFSLFAALALATGELVGLTVAALGVWYSLAHHQIRRGALIATAGAAWTLFCLALVIPAFNNGRSSRFYDRFESVGGSPVGLLRTALTDPSTIVSAVSTPSDLRYLLLLALPTAFIFLVQPLILVAALPQLGVNTTSQWTPTTSPMNHYSAPVVALVVAATILSVGRFAGRARTLAAFAPLCLAILVLASMPPAPGADRYLFPAQETAERTAAMRSAVSLVPPDASVTATNRLGAHLSARRVIHVFPNLRGSSWAVVDIRDPSNRAEWVQPSQRKRSLAELRRRGTWRLLFAREGVYVYRRA